MYASTSALDRLGHISVRLPGRHFEPSGRSDLGSRKPIPILQSQPIFRIARGRVQRGARRPIGAVAGRYRLATERALNDPDCKDASTPDRCAATAGKRYQQSRLGWAAQTLDETCYESNGRPRRYAGVCERKYSWGTAKEDYVLPEAHTVAIRIAPGQLAGVSGDCIWAWQPRRAGGKTETKRSACTDKLTIARVPYALDRGKSGVSVTVKLPDGRELSEPEVVVEDLFIVALGDSFASGESNPDRPVQFSAQREMVYDPALQREELASRTPAKDAAPGYGLASGDDQTNPKVLPRRLMDDETGRDASTSSLRPSSSLHSKRRRRAG